MNFLQRLKNQKKMKIKKINFIFKRGCFLKKNFFVKRRNYWFVFLSVFLFLLFSFSAKAFLFWNSDLDSVLIFPRQIGGNWLFLEKVKNLPDVSSDGEKDNFSTENSAIYWQGEKSLVLSDFSQTEADFLIKTEEEEILEKLQQPTGSDNSEENRESFFDQDQEKKDNQVDDKEKLEENSLPEENLNQDDSQKELKIDVNSDSKTTLLKYRSRFFESGFLKRLKGFFENKSVLAKQLIGFQELKDFSLFSVDLNFSMAIKSETEEKIKKYKQLEDDLIEKEKEKKKNKDKEEDKGKLKTTEETGNLESEKNSLYEEQSDLLNSNNGEDEEKDTTTNIADQSKDETKVNQKEDTNENKKLKKSNEDEEKIKNEEKQPVVKMEDVEIDSKVLVYYSIEKNNWKKLTSINYSSISNSENKGFFSYKLEGIDGWDKLKNLKIRLEGVVDGQVESVVYLDSVWLDVSYSRVKSSKVKGKELKLKGEKEDWNYFEKPKFKIDKKESFINKIKDWLIFWSEDTQVRLKLINAEKQEIELKRGEDYILVNDSEIELNPNLLDKIHPGKYTLQTFFEEGDQLTILTQDFTWGVLAINTNKSIYSPQEQGNLSFAVLDEKGMMVCDAELSLFITNDELKINDELSTKNGRIKVNKEICNLHKFSLEPDYEGEYKFGDEGVYTMRLEAETKNGKYTIWDKVEVRKKIPFDVERITATRIYPPANYPVTLKIVANQDFKGDVIETVPDNFQIFPSGGKDDLKFEVLDSSQIENKNSLKDSENQQNKKQIIWKVKLKKGEKISLSYNFKAPNVSPEFYLLGPLEFKEKNKLSFWGNEIVFQELRQWQIASDDPPTYQMKTGYYIGNGGAKSITGLGFSPEMVIVKADTTAGTGAYLKTSAMPFDNVAYLVGATANDTSNMIRLDSDGFTVAGTNANVANNRYTWIAFAGSDCSASGNFCVGAYAGSGTSPRAVTTGFQPDLVLVKASTTGNAANWRSSSMPTNYAQFFQATNQDTAGAYFTTLNSDGFTVGATNNASSVYYYFAAFKNVSDSINVGSFTGNATDNRSITGVGFQPDFVWVKNANASTAVSGVYSVNESYGDSSSYFTDTANLVDAIQALQSDGFQVGANSTVNGSGNTIYYAAFNATSSYSTGSGTFQMASGTYTGVGSTGQFISINNLDFTPDLVIIKGNTTQAGVFRTSLMAGDITAYLDSATADFSGGIVSLNKKGFTIGSSAVVNTSGVTYYWTAYGNAWTAERNSGAADFSIGVYYGNGLDNRDITNQPFQPDLITVKRSGASGGVFRTSLHSGDSSSYFTATADAANLIQSLGSSSFQIGTGANVNTAASNYWYFSFKSGTNFVVNSYTGNGSSQNITTAGFQPDNLWVKATTTQYAVQRTSGASGNLALPFINVAGISNAITGLLSNGFSVGSATQTNSSGVSYRYAAWKTNTSFSPPTYQMKTGYYIGNGGAKSITGLGFSPEMVIVKAGTTAGTGAYLKTSAMPFDNVAYLVGATANDTSNMIRLDSDGFTVAGTNANVANNRYTWIAFAGSDCSASGNFCVGAYAGSGTSPRAVTTGFQPDLVLVKASTTGNAANWRSSSMPTNYAQFFQATNQDTAGAYFTTLNSDGFTVGATNNASSVYYYFAAFKNVSDSINVGSFTGNATDNRSITGVGFQPDFVWVKNANASTAVSGVYSVNESYGDSSSYFTDTANLVDAIQALQSDGFQVGANSTVNGSGNTIYYAAFNATSSYSTGSGTFQMASGTYTGVGSTGQFISINNLDFTPDLVIIKGNTTQAGVFRTSLMAGDITAYLDSATADFSGGIVSLNKKGFTIGSSAVVNTSGVTYYWTAYGNAWTAERNSGAADFSIGVYYGNGLDNRDITNQPFQPDLITVKRSGASGGVFRTSLHSGDSSSYFTATADAANLIQSLGSSSFQIGTGANVNTAASNYWYFSFKSGTNFVVNSYTGNGSSQNITTAGFQPDNLWVKATTTQYAVQRTSGASGNLALPFINVAGISNAITGLLSNGFSVGSATQTNSSGVSYRYAAWRVPVTGITISGNIYQTNETSLDTTAYSIYASVNNGTPIPAVVPGDGSYVISGVNASSGDSIAVYIYNHANNANAMTVSDGSTDINQLNLIIDRVTVKSLDGLTPIDNSKICNQSNYPGTGDNLFSCSGSNLTLSSGAEFHILAGADNLYDTSSGILTTSGSGGFHIDDSASANINSNSSIAGDISIDSGASLTVGPGVALSIQGDWINNGSFSSASSYVNFNASSDQNITGSNPTSFNTITFSGSGTKTLQTGTVVANGDLILSGTSELVLATDLNVYGQLSVNLGTTLNLGSSGYNLTLSGYGKGINRPLYINGGTLNKGTNSTVIFKGSSDTDVEIGNYYNLTFAPSSGNPTFTPLGTLSIYGKMTIGDGSNAVVFDSNNQSLSVRGDFEIKSGASFVAPSSASFNVSGNWTNNGLFNANSGTVTFDGTSSQTLSGTTTTSSSFYNLNVENNSTAGVYFSDNLTTSGLFSNNTAGSKMIFATNKTFSFNNIDIDGNSSNKIIMTSDNASPGTPSGPQWFLNVSASSPTVSYVTVYDSDATGGNTIDDTLGGINGGNNENWLFSGINISGKIYSDEGSSAYDCSTNNLTVRVKINGSGNYSGVCTSSDGSFVVGSVNLNGAGDVITVFLDEETEKAVVVTRAANNTSDISGLDLYQNYLIVRHEDAGPITNSDLGSYDKNDDSDIHFTSNSGNLSVDNDFGLHIWSGKYYTPGGTVTTGASSLSGSVGGDIHINSGATMNVGSNTVSCGGDWKNNGTFTFSGSQTTVFTATGSGFNIIDGGSAFYNLSFNGSGGGWLYKDGTPTAPNQTAVSAGTVTFLNAKTGNVSVSGGTLNQDWYLGVHIVDAVNNSINIDTGENEVTVLAANSNPMVWVYNNGWGSGAVSQNTGTNSDGKNPQPENNGAIRIREYSMTNSATCPGSGCVLYKYNLQVGWQNDYGEYDYYDDYGQNYLTSCLAGTTANCLDDSVDDDVIGVNWYRSSIGNLNVPYDNLNEPPTKGSWYVGLLESVNFSISSNSVDLGEFTPGGSPNNNSNVLTVTTSASHGYTVYAYALQDMSCTNTELCGSATVPDWSGTNTNPSAWNPGSFGFGYSTDDISLSGGEEDRFSGPKYAGFINDFFGDPIADRNGPSYNQQNTITYRMAAGSVQTAGSYQANIVYVIVPNY